MSNRLFILYFFMLENQWILQNSYNDAIYIGLKNNNEYTWLICIDSVDKK